MLISNLNVIVSVAWSFSGLSTIMEEPLGGKEESKRKLGRRPRRGKNQAIVVRST